MNRLRFSGRFGECKVRKIYLIVNGRLNRFRLSHLRAITLFSFNAIILRVVATILATHHITTRVNLLSIVVVKVSVSVVKVGVACCFVWVIVEYIIVNAIDAFSGGVESTSGGCSCEERVFYVAGKLVATRQFTASCVDTNPLKPLLCSFSNPFSE